MSSSSPSSISSSAISCLFVELLWSPLYLKSGLYMSKFLLASDKVPALMVVLLVFTESLSSCYDLQSLSFWRRDSQLQSSCGPLSDCWLSKILSKSSCTSEISSNSWTILFFQAPCFFFALLFFFPPFPSLPTFFWLLSSNGGVSRKILLLNELVELFSVSDD